MFGGRRPPIMRGPPPGMVRGGSGGGRGGRAFPWPMREPVDERKSKMPCQWPEDGGRYSRGPDMRDPRAREMLEYIARQQALNGPPYEGYGPHGISRPPRAKREPRYTRHFRSG